MSDEILLYSLPLILADNFSEFAEILADEESFPGSQAAWERLVEAHRAELEDEGYTAQFIEVRPSGFRRFLTEAGVAPSMDTLAAYVALLAQGGRSE